MTVKFPRRLLRTAQVAAAAAVLAPPVVLADAVDDIPPGQWFEVPNSELEDVSSAGFPNVMTPWSGGAFDTQRNRLVVFGGGHGNYSGNELYAFDMDTLSWVQVTQPTSPPVMNSDGSSVPSSRHTYDGVQYLPHLDRLWSAGGSIYENGNCSGKTWTYQFGAASPSAGWQRHDNEVDGCVSMSAFDPVTRNVWYWNKDQGVLEFDTDSMDYTQRRSDPRPFEYMTGAIDPVRRKFVVVGSGEFFVFDITDPSNVTKSSPSTSGATGIEQAKAPGFVYDPDTQLLVAWSSEPNKGLSGRDLYTLDLDDMRWTKHEPSGGNSVTPTRAAGPDERVNGTFGRFQYAPAEGVFVVVNDIDENVYIYRPDFDGSGGGNPGDPLPTVDLSADRSEVAEGDDVTLSWASTNATACESTGAWSGDRATSGNWTSGALNDTSTFVLTCSGPGGAASDSVTVSVTSSDPAPTLSFGASPASVETGDTSELTWSTTDADSCVAVGDWSGDQPVDGSETVGPLSETSDYTLSCDGPGGSVAETVTVTVTAPDPDPTPDPDPNPGPGPGGNPSLEDLANLEPGYWYEVPDTVLEDISHTTYPDVMKPWSGGAWDSLRNRLIIFGGGHNNYDGNEIYVFDVDTLEWEQLYLPTDPPVRDQDGNSVPSSRHTYDGLVYLPPPHDQLWSAGGSYWFNGFCNGRTWTYQFGSGDASGWEKRDDDKGGCNSTSAYDPVTGKVWYWNKPGGLWEYDPQAAGNPYRLRYDQDRPFFNMTGEIDPVRRKYIVMGDDEFFEFDISDPSNVTMREVNTSGADEIVGGKAPGLVYNPDIDRMVAWSGQPSRGIAKGNVYTLDMDTMEWTRHEPAPGNTVIPTRAAGPASNANGTFGRWQYVPTMNLYLLVNDVDENVFFYRLDIAGGAPTSPPTVTLGAQPDRLGPGASTVITWNALDADECTASGGWSGSRPTSGSESSQPLFADAVFQLQCTGPGGTTQESVSVTVEDGVATPTLDFESSTDSVSSGGTAVLTWSSTNADACEASGDWGGSRNLSGNETVGPLTVDSQFVLECTGVGGEVRRTIDIDVADVSLGMTLSASPASVVEGETAELTWTTEGATSCVASDSWSGGRAVNGTEVVGPLSESSGYTLTCEFAGGAETSRTVFVEVTPRTTGSVSLVANPSSIQAGETTELTWSAEGATSCSASGGWGGSPAPSGTTSVGPLDDTTTYTLSCDFSGGVRASDSVTVTVTPRTGGGGGGGGGGAGGASSSSGGGGAAGLGLAVVLLLGAAVRRRQRQ